MVEFLDRHCPGAVFDPGDIVSLLSVNEQDKFLQSQSGSVRLDSFVYTMASKGSVEVNMTFVDTIHECVLFMVCFFC